MKNLLLKVSYDGTDFCGWQRQDKADSGKPLRTVQGELEIALNKMLKEPISVNGSGRTDSGVHAFGQRANFLSPYDSIPAENYILALNGFLPRDIRVLESKEVPLDFHARFNAVCRTYRYFMSSGTTVPAHQMRYVWPLRHKPNLETLNSMASCLSGEIDFTTFAAAGDLCPSKCRFIEKAIFYTQEDKIVFEISANAFLWKMVRSIVGSLIYYEHKGKDGKFFSDILYAKDRSLAGPTAPPWGLFLWDVDYDGIRRH